MDNLMDKFAQKLSAQEMIRANEAAEAAEQERLKKQAEAYEKELDFIKSSLDKLQKDINDNTHDVGVRTWRNVEASIKEISAGNLEAIKEVNNEKILELSKQATSEVCKEYTDNIKQITIEENKKELEIIKEEFKKVLKRTEELEVEIETKNSAVVPISIITLLMVIANLVVIILNIVGII
ncbi:MAG: hypothetical protein K6A23_12200 [Butyrivibrio sp.]|nr:hypothetical protein [Butyrivibrio sp.]